MNPFQKKLHAHGVPLKRGRFETLQINVGRKCNQVCTHCHVDAGPHRTEMMTEEIAERVGAGKQLQSGDKRCAGYEAVGYTILLPASALPGWPSEVPLPIDPVWKNDYSASVRRLVRDGVDAPLAGLFVVATKPASDEQRARSAAEAFLFRRLESLKETAGLFHLNVKLPIPFDGWSEMEVDLYCVDLKLAIEIDGPQHLGDPAAYRRDRRKDALLQENGCHVLRFLAGDLSEHLGATLDSIHRGIAHLTDSITARKC